MAGKPPFAQEFERAVLASREFETLARTRHPQASRGELRFATRANVPHPFEIKVRRDPNRR